MQEFAYVFPNEVSRLPPKRDIDSTINLVSGVAPVSKYPCRMTTLKLVDLNISCKHSWKKATLGQECLLGEHICYLLKKGWDFKAVY